MCRPNRPPGVALALVQEGDEIELDVASRRLELRISDDEMNRRRAAWVIKEKTAPTPRASGGYQQLYIDHVQQSDRGADFDFLLGCRGAGIPRESH